MYLERPSGAAGPYYRRRSAIATNLPNELFVVDPARYQAITNAAGMLGLTTPRDTFFTSLTKCALPTRLVSSVDAAAVDLQTPRSATLTDDLGGPRPNKLGTTKTLMLQSSLFHDFLAIKVIQLDSFVEAWGVFVDQIQDTTVKAAPTAGGGEEGNGRRGLGAHVGDGGPGRGRDPAAGGKALSFVPESAHKASKQESLVAFLGVVQCTLRTSRALDGVEWPLERLTRLMAILKGMVFEPGILTTLNPNRYIELLKLARLLHRHRPTPSRPTIVLDTIADIDLSAARPSAYHQRPRRIRDARVFRRVQRPANPANGHAPTARNIHHALHQKVVPTHVSLFLAFRECVEIYADGALEALLSAYAIHVKLRYDCPPSSQLEKSKATKKTMGLAAPPPVPNVRPVTPDADSLVRYGGYADDDAKKDIEKPSGGTGQEQEGPSQIGGA
ncbi:hypothetical protein MKEN_00356800 [Mycena kentingensis (nom. inval.)]|nr:hypothetical protein MKEN_00356800 [Mycena kentingensis (nom. inval.)]